MNSIYPLRCKVSKGTHFSICNLYYHLCFWYFKLSSTKQCLTSCVHHFHCPLTTVDTVSEALLWFSFCQQKPIFFQDLEKKLAKTWFLLFIAGQYWEKPCLVCKAPIHLQDHTFYWLMPKCQGKSVILCCI